MYIVAPLVVDRIYNIYSDDFLETSATIAAMAKATLLVTILKMLTVAGKLGLEVGGYCGFLIRLERRSCARRNGAFTTLNNYIA